MPVVGKTFRIFVSSTFSDMKEERNALQKDVFPKLRELCSQYGCRFQGIDLRWGVSEGASIDQQTMKICLTEIERCQEVSPNLNFIMLLGDRYGWQPLPTEIPADEMDEIISLLSSKDIKKMKEWYRLDKNAVPNVYCLQPRKGPFVNPNKWEKEERKIHSILFNAVNKMQLPPGRVVRYTASATEQEILKGALDEDVFKENVFGFFRSFESFNFGGNSKAFKDFFDIDEHSNFDKVAYLKQKELKKKIKEHLKDNIISYDVKWTDWIKKEKKKNKIIKTLCNKVYKSLEGVIKKEFESLKQEDVLTKEIKAHDQFCKERGDPKFFTGREEILESIQEYINGNAPHPLAVYGDPGSGKSALLAHAVLQAKYSRVNLVYRFIGVTPGSSDIRSLLMGICREISTLYNFGTEVPHDYRKLKEEFLNVLSLVPEEKPLIIFFDALDQLSDANDAQNLEWLPSQLPAYVRLVISTINKSKCFDQLSIKIPTHQMLNLAPLSIDKGEELLEKWLSAAGRKLKEKQLKNILGVFNQNGLPLFLKLAFEEVRSWHSYDKNLSFSKDIYGVITDLFNRLSRKENHGRILVAHTLSYLSAGKNGVTEDELLDLLSDNQAVMEDFKKTSLRHPAENRLPFIIWSRLFFDLRAYLRERYADNTFLLSFFYNQLGKVASDRYLKNSSKLFFHRHLAKYFKGQPNFLDPDSNKQPNYRKLSELPWQQTKGEMWDEIEESFLDINFLEAKAKAGMVGEMVEDFSIVVNSIPIHNQWNNLLFIIRRVIYNYADFITEEPSSLFQCLWNHSWWYDSPDAKLHYVKEDRTPGSHSSNQGHLKISTILEQWLKTKEEKSSSLLWIKSIRPDTSIPIGTDQETVFHAHNAAISGLVISPDGKFLVSSSKDNQIRIWDLNRGIVVASHQANSPTVTYSQDGTCSIFLTSDGSVWTWNTAEGFKLQRTLDKNGYFFTISPGGKFAASWLPDFKGGEIHIIWDISTGKAIASLNSNKEHNKKDIGSQADYARVTSGFDLWFWGKDRCAVFSKSSDYFVYAERDGTVRGYDLCYLREIFCDRERIRQPTTCIAISPDETQIITGIIRLNELLGGVVVDHRLVVRDAVTGKQLEDIYPPREIAFSSAAYSSDGRRVVTGSIDGSVDVWDSNSHAELAKFHNHNSKVTCLAFSQDDKKVAAGAADGTIRIFNVSNGQKSPRLINHHGEIKCILFSPDGKWLATGGIDGTIKLWDSNKGIQLACLEWGTLSIVQLLFSNDGKLLASKSQDGKILVWNTENGNLEEIQTRILMGKNAFTFLSHRLIYAFFSRKGIQIWDGSNRPWYSFLSISLKKICSYFNRNYFEKGVPGGRRVTFLENFNSTWVSDCFVFSNDGRRIACEGIGKVGVWDTVTGRQLGYLGLPEKFTIFASLIFSPDGTRVAGVSPEGSIFIWDIYSNKTFEDFNGLGKVLKFSFSPNGEQIVVSFAKGITCIWNINDKKLIKVLRGVGDCTAIASNCQWYALSDGKRTRIYSSKTGEIVSVFPIHFNTLVEHPEGGIWAGANGGHLYIISLEGIKKTSGNEIEENEEKKIKI